MSTPGMYSSRSEVNQARICNCGHVSGIHYDPTGVCKAENCACIAFREFVPQSESGFDPKQHGQGYYGKSDEA